MAPVLKDCGSDRGKTECALRFNKYLKLTPSVGFVVYSDLTGHGTDTLYDECPGQLCVLVSKSIIFIRTLLELHTCRFTHLRRK